MKWDHSLIDTLEWGNQISHKEDKIKIADLIASKVENGQVIGVGSGSTSYLALIRIANVSGRNVFPSWRSPLH